MAAQGDIGTDFYHRSSRTIVGTMLWTQYRPVIKIGPKGALGSHVIRPIHSAPSLGQSIVELHSSCEEFEKKNKKISLKFLHEELYTVHTIDSYGDYLFSISMDIYHELSEYPL